MLRGSRTLVGDASLGRRLLLMATGLVWSLSESAAGWGVPAQAAPPMRSAAAVQAAPPVVARPAALPEPVYWRQHLFLIPYQWGSAAEPGVAQSVWLFVSKDRGATWRKISEARPDVKAFNYRAEGDGEYWFAVRTLDKQGRAWPAGPYQPELRVIVDTTLPTIDELRVRPAENEAFEIQSRATDLNLNPDSWKFEWQANPAAAWQPVMLQAAANTGPSPMPQQPGLLPITGPQLHAFWQPPPGSRPIAFRGTVSDRAGNSATYQTRIDSGADVSGPLLAAPLVSAAAAPQQVNPIPSVPSSPLANLPSMPTQAWTPGTAAPAEPATTASPMASQSWPANNAHRAPFQLWTNNTARPDDGVTSYGSPPLLDASPSSSARSDFAHDEPRTEARYASIENPAANFMRGNAREAPSRPQYASLEPYREASRERLSAAPTSSSLVPIRQPSARDVTPVDSPAAQHSPPTAPKQVGSRTFALEYDLDDAGRGGVLKVELWGTRDGGKTWNCYAQDDDNRSPIVVTVDEQGLYGFRILVQNAAAAAADPPHSGDAPELWVLVDLKRPVVELTAIEHGQGNLTDHLILRWRATDNNLEARPIGLFYSSQPSGPWSAVATNLENTGEYSWRVERYVPARFYLRVEARDTAGNLAAFQTREPVEFSPGNLVGRLRSAEPLNTTASGTSDPYR